MAVLKDLIVHGSSRFINAALFNSLAGNKISANEGVFNKLIATNLTAEQASITDLTATNAKIVGLLDVTKGELHTSKWTNANMSNIGGSFYISPTVNTTIASNDTPMSITFGGSANNRTIQVTGGNFTTDAVKIYDTTQNPPTTHSVYSSGTTPGWPVGSHVMVTGNIRLNNNGVDYPLGTLTGYLTGALSSGGFTVGEINSSALETIINEIGTNNIISYDISISMFEIGPKATVKPVGIMMTSYGVDKSTYIDIYGGVNQKNSTTGKTEPNLRIGYLGDLPVIRLSNNDSRTFQPTGWGIYTDNGYFKGTIVSNTGVIGNFTIANELYTGNDGEIGQGTNVYVSPGTISSANIANSLEYDEHNIPISKIWAFTAGSNFGVTTEGILYSSGTKIGNENSYMNFITQIDYVVTKDGTVNPSKTYYTYDNNTDTYIEVINPSGNPSDKNPEWFEQITNGTLQIVGSSIQVGGQDLSTAINNKADNNMMLALDAIVNSQAWKDEFWEYELTEDSSIIEDKQYYQYEFSSTSDTEILLDKTYYIYTPLNNNDYYTSVANPQESELLSYYERGDNLEQYNFNNLITANPQALELYELIENNNNYITNFLTSHLSINSSGLTITDKNSQYKIFLGYDGLYILEEIEKTTIIEGETVKSTEDIVVSKFGENIEFNNKKTQRIGNDNTYIQFTPEVEEYILTTDNTVVLNKSYYLAESTNEYTIVVIQSLNINPNSLGWYEKVNNVYQITDDESLILGKDYYVNKDNEKIKITIVDNDNSINPYANNWYEKINNVYQITNDESLLDKDYYIRNIITNYNLVSNPSGNPQSQNWFEKEVYDGFLEVVASRLIVSNNSVDNFISATNERIENIDTELNTNSVAITNIRDDFDEFHKNFQNYIIIDSNHGFIRVGHEIQSEDLGISSSYVEINGASSSPKVSINVGGQEVVYMSSDRFHAPSAVVTSLFMQRENVEGTGTIGEIGWVMRSNKHLSLKRIK